MSQKTIPVSPHLLSMFDPFNILEPQKNDSLTNDGPKVERLIDIDDCSSDSGIDASFLDQKPEYNLVDLYQNLYVTPQHVIAKNTSIQNGGINDVDSRIDFKDFSDKLGSVKTEQTQKSEYEELKRMKMLSPKVHGEESDPEELIEEVLAKKSVEKRVMDEISGKNVAVSSKHVKNDFGARLEFPLNQSLSEIKGLDARVSFKQAKKDLCGVGFPLHKVLGEINDTDNRVNHKQELEFPRPKLLCSPNIDDLKVNKKINNKNKSNDTCSNINFPSCSKSETKYDITELSRLNLNNGFCLKTDQSQENNIFKTFKPDNVQTKIKIDGQINNSSDFKVIAIKKDEKVFKKRNILKPESVTSNFTKGADFKEKSIVLPQIMNRIIVRQAYLEDRSLSKKVLILDGGNNNDMGAKSGSSAKDANSNNTDSTYGKVNPVTLMEDCNKVRLKAFESGRLFQNFVMKGK